MLVYFDDGKIFCYGFGDKIPDNFIKVEYTDQEVRVYRQKLLRKMKSGVSFAGQAVFIDAERQVDIFIADYIWSLKTEAEKAEEMALQDYMFGEPYEEM